MDTLSDFYDINLEQQKNYLFLSETDFKNGNIFRKDKEIEGQT